MPKKHLNEKVVKSLKADVQTDFWDTVERGFGVRVTPQGTKTFFVLYRLNGRRIRMTIGRFPDLELAVARGKAAEAKRAAANGRNPHEEKRTARAAETFAELADEYLERYAKKNKRSWREDDRILKKDLLPAWKSRKAQDITRRDVKRLLNGIVDRGSPIVANRTLALISRIFNYGIDEELLETNPAARVPKPGVEHDRDRVLKDSEIRALWKALENEDPLNAATFKLRLLTAQRGVEVFSMRWDDIEGEWWTIPATVSKNKLSHRVPLSPQALEVLQDLEGITGTDEWVFPSRRSTGGHFDRHSVKKAAARLRQAAKLKDFRPHDLRRTAATKMTSTGIARLVVSKILNHVETGVTAVYDRASYDAEKKRALTLWGDRLMKILEEKETSNVVRIG